MGSRPALELVDEIKLDEDSEVRDDESSWCIFCRDFSDASGLRGIPLMFPFPSTCQVDEPALPFAAVA